MTSNINLPQNNQPSLLKKVIILLTIAVCSIVLATSCRHCPDLVSSTTTSTTTDSSWSKQSVKHDTVYSSVPGPTIVLPGPCDSLCDKNGKLKNFHRETKKNGIIGSIKTNTLTNSLSVDCREDSLKRVIDSITIINTRLIRENTDTRDVVSLPCDKEHRNWIDRLARWWLWISLGILVGVGLFKYRKLLKFF